MEQRTTRNYGETLTVNEVAEILRIGRNNAYALIQRAEREKDFPVLRLGQQYRLPTTRFFAWMNKQDGEKNNDDSNKE